MRTQPRIRRRFDHIASAPQNLTFSDMQDNRNQVSVLRLVNPGAVEVGQNEALFGTRG